MVLRARGRCCSGSSGRCAGAGVCANDGPISSSGRRLRARGVSSTLKCRLRAGMLSLAGHSERDRTSNVACRRENLCRRRCFEVNIDPACPCTSPVPCRSGSALWARVADGNAHASGSAVRVFWPLMSSVVLRAVDGAGLRAGSAALCGPPVGHLPSDSSIAIVGVQLNAPGRQRARDHRNPEGSERRSNSVPSEATPLFAAA